MNKYVFYAGVYAVISSVFCVILFNFFPEVAFDYKNNFFSFTGFLWALVFAEWFRRKRNGKKNKTNKYEKYIFRGGYGYSLMSFFISGLIVIFPDTAGTVIAKNLLVNFTIISCSFSIAFLIKLPQEIA